MSKKTIIGVAVAAVIAVYAFGSATYVPQGQEATLTGEVSFDPISVATNFWQNQAQDYFAQNAVELTELIQKANSNLANMAKEYGHYSMGDSGELSYIVKGSGTVSEVKNKLRSGYIALDVSNSADYEIRLQIGPVYKGSAVRDSISLISYRDYKNQIEWADISKAFHDLISEQIIAPLDMDSLQGKQISFIGSFTVNDKRIQITPVKIDVQ